MGLAILRLPYGLDVSLLVRTLNVGETAHVLLPQISLAPKFDRYESAEAPAIKRNESTEFNLDTIHSETSLRDSGTALDHDGFGPEETGDETEQKNEDFDDMRDRVGTSESKVSDISDHGPIIKGNKLTNKEKIFIPLNSNVIFKEDVTSQIQNTNPVHQCIPLTRLQPKSCQRLSTPLLRPRNCLWLVNCLRICSLRSWDRSCRMLKRI